MTTAATTKKNQACENTCFRRLLHIPLAEHKTNDFVRSNITALTVPPFDSEKEKGLKPGMIRPRHNHSENIGSDRWRSRQRKPWVDNIRE